MRLINIFWGDLEPDAPYPLMPLTMLVIDGDTPKPKTNCESCGKLLIKHKLITNPPNTHKDWCINCNDALFIKRDGIKAHGVWVQNQVAKGKIIQIIMSEANPPKW
tara:strand:- start:170 stop:487 length:318 start_codon:yes stop_codon:yes gene_type:complete